VELPRVTKKEKEKSPAEKRVNLAIHMSDVCVRIASDAVRDKNPKIKEKEILEQVRKRIMHRRHRMREV